MAALRDGVRERMGYPAATGLPELREAIAAWIRRRFGVALDPDTQIVPTLGSKEAIFSFAHVVLDPGAGKDTVILTEPGYPVPERGALFAGGRVVALPLHEERAFLPALDAVDEDDWARAALVWVNYPNNPTGATAPLAFYDRIAELAREHGFVLASDEAYSELWFDEPPASALQLEDLTGVAVFNTLSKRSSMTGYRSGFVAGDAELIDALKRFRPTVGTAPQEFVQRASVVAWSDEGHVGRARASYTRSETAACSARERRSAISRAAARRCTSGPPCQAERRPRISRPACSSTASSSRRARIWGPSGEGYIRLALVPTLEECERAASILEDVL